LSPTEAGKKVGQTVTVAFVVQSTGRAGNRVFLNSESDRNSAANFTVVLEKPVVDALAQQQIDNPAMHYRGKRIRVTGRVESFRDSPQIKVTEIKNFSELAD
ncbi:MAG TPA: alkaline phosphatase family protein, partial [Gemmatales bacterium]|nr:alkaline phosphatase family protein [Gemmatales bacterium]